MDPLNASCLKKQLYGFVDWSKAVHIQYII